MFSEKDFERLWFLYKTEGEPKGVYQRVSIISAKTSTVKTICI